MPRYGYHIDPPLADIPLWLADRDANTFQTTLRNPNRLSKEAIPDADDQAAYRAAAQEMEAQIGTLWGMAHASLLTNLASLDPRIRHGSAGALVADANLAATLGLHGVCFHGGYQKGHATREEALDALVRKLDETLEKLAPGAQVWLENSCEGTELCQTVAELGTVARAVANPDRLGLVLDTCHLHVAGFDLAAPDAPERLAEQLEQEGLLPFLRALHLNDAREACGSHRDRHAIPGQGTIGDGLRRLVAHPLFAPLPAILELSASAAALGIDYLTD